MSEAVILVVEDEALVGMELQESLQKAGYSVPEVVIFSDKIIPAMVRHKPDLILMDINLNSLSDGVSAVQRMNMGGAVPVIYLTAYRDALTKERAMRTNPKDYLVKPVSDKQLLEAVEQALVPV